MNTSSAVLFNPEQKIESPFNGGRYVMPMREASIRYWSSRNSGRTAEDVFLGGDNPIVEFTKSRIVDIENHIKGLGDYTYSYSSRGQPDGMKNSVDAFYGKVGEFIAQDDIEKTTKISKGVDLKIYPISHKSWEPDLKSGKFLFQVKSHNVFGGGWPSWVFEVTDKSIFSNSVSMPLKDLIVVFTVVSYERDRNGKTVRCRGRVFSYNWLSELHDNNMFMPMINQKLTTKKAIYSHLLHSKNMIHTLKDIVG